MMTDLKALIEAFDAANEFLRPVLKRGTHSGIPEKMM